MVVAPTRAPAAPAAPAARAARRRDLVAATGLLALLAVVVGLRFEAIQAGIADPIAAGFAFGVGLLLVPATDRAWLQSLRMRRGLARAVVIGALGGAFLVALAIAGDVVTSAPALPPAFRADLLVPWALATIVVAAGEESVLRGAVFDRLTHAGGVTAAIVITSAAFALMHVPFYGWRVVPLDLGVGLWLAGLRLASGGVVAPAVAHAIADLATWWL